VTYLAVFFSFLRPRASREEGKEVVSRRGRRLFLSVEVFSGLADSHRRVASLVRALLFLFSRPRGVRRLLAARSRDSPPWLLPLLREGLFDTEMADFVSSAFPYLLPPVASPLSGQEIPSSKLREATGPVFLGSPPGFPFNLAELCSFSGRFFGLPLR